MALDFNGTSGLINCGSPSSLDNIFTGGATVMAWIYPQGWGGFGWGRFLDKAGTTFPYDGWTFLVADAGDEVRFAIDWYNAPGNWATPDSSITLNNWYHAAVSYNSGSSSNVPKIYLNGVSQSLTVVSNPSGSLMTDAGADMSIGNQEDGVVTFDGYVGDARAYDRILSDAEIQTIYASRGHDAIVDDLVGRWLLNEGAPGTNPSGSGVIKDLSNYGNHGTPSAGPMVYREDPLEFNRRVA